MHVLERTEIAVLASCGARPDHRQLALERHHPLHDKRRADGAAGSRQLGGVAHAALPLAVVPEAGGLDDRRVADLLRHRIVGGSAGGAHGARRSRQRTPRRDRKPRVAEELLFRAAILRRREHLGAGTHHAVTGGSRHRRAGQVLELEGQQVDAGGKRADRAGVVVAAHHFARRHLAGGRPALVGVYLHPVAKRRRRAGEHAPELAAAQDADGGPRQDRIRRGRCPCHVGGHGRGRRPAPLAGCFDGGASAAVERVPARGRPWPAASTAAAAEGAGTEP